MEQDAKKQQCPNVLVFTRGMHSVLESEEQWSYLDGVYT